MIPRLVSCGCARIVFWNSVKESPFRVVIPIAPCEVWVKTYVSGVLIYSPSKIPFISANFRYTVVLAVKVQGLQD